MLLLEVLAYHDTMCRFDASLELELCMKRSGKNNGHPFDCATAARKCVLDPLAGYNDDGTVPMHVQHGEM